MDKNLGLAFVYNADRGFFNLMADISHKMLFPSTYPCNLCALTHGTFSMRKEWREFLAKIKPPLTFMHRDEFRKEFKLEDNLPAIYIKDLRTEKLRPFIDAPTLKALTGLEDLKQMINNKLTLEGLL
ncbi:MAG: hypothetical protein CK551_01305 [Planctomycetaceae bacterium]|nr:hypothetical protein [Gemmataceae bacterium]PHX64349.1 MAG: hypothetical protein CK551_01305 [Planctomycetaceae bacterium]